MGDIFIAGLAQMVEQLPCKHQVESSIPSAGTNFFQYNHPISLGAVVCSGDIICSHASPSVLCSSFLCPFWDFSGSRVDAHFNFLAKRKNKFSTRLAYLWARVRTYCLRGNPYINVLLALMINVIQTPITPVELRYFLTDRYFLWALSATVNESWFDMRSRTHVYLPL